LEEEFYASRTGLLTDFSQTGLTGRQTECLKRKEKLGEEMTQFKKKHRTNGIIFCRGLSCREARVPEVPVIKIG